MSTNSKKQTAATIALWLGIATVIGYAALVVVGVDTGSEGLFAMSAGCLIMTAGLLVKRNASQYSEKDAEATQG